MTLKSQEAVVATALCRRAVRAIGATHIGTSTQRGGYSAQRI